MASCVRELTMLWLPSRSGSARSDAVPVWAARSSEALTAEPCGRFRSVMIERSADSSAENSRTAPHSNPVIRSNCARTAAASSSTDAARRISPALSNSIRNRLAGTGRGSRSRPVTEMVECFRAPSSLSMSVADGSLSPTPRTNGPTPIRSPSRMGTGCPDSMATPLRSVPWLERSRSIQPPGVGRNWA